MKLLITGAAGFIGSNLCEFMLQKGYDVVGLDNLATGFMHNLNEFKSHPNFSFIEADIRDYESCVKATQGGRLCPSSSSNLVQCKIPQRTQLHQMTLMLPAFKHARSK